MCMCKSVLAAEDLPNYNLTTWFLGKTAQWGCRQLLRVKKVGKHGWTLKDFPRLTEGSGNKFFLKRNQHFLSDT